MTAHVSAERDAAGFVRLRTMLLSGAEPLLDTIVNSGLQFGDPDLMRQLAEAGLDYVMSFPVGSMPTALSPEVAQLMSDLAKSVSAEWEIPAQVRRSAYHEAFAFAVRFLSERAFAAGVSKRALTHWVAVLSAFETLVHEHTERIATDMAESRERDLRRHAATMLARFVDDPVVAGVAAQDSSDTWVAPPWLHHADCRVAVILVQPCAANHALTPLVLPKTSDMPRLSLHASTTEQVVLLTPADHRRETAAAASLLFPDARVIVGLAVGRDNANHSLAWCRRVALLLRQGVVASSGPQADVVIDCGDNALALLIGADLTLLQALVADVLEPLQSLSGYNKEMMIETLAAWARHPHASVPRLAQHLDKHPQTVRYRLRQLRELFGDVLDDEHHMLLVNVCLRYAGKLD